MRSWAGILWVVVLAGGTGATGFGCGNVAGVQPKDAAQAVDAPVSSGGTAGTGGMRSSGGVTGTGGAVGSGGATVMGGTTGTTLGGAGGSAGADGGTTSGTGGRKTGGTAAGGSGATAATSTGAARTGGVVGSGGAGVGGVVGSGGIGGSAVGGKGGAATGGAGGTAAGSASSDGGSLDGTSGCIDVCTLYGEACCLWPDPCLVPSGSCTFDVLAASAGTTYEYADLETKVAALPQEISTSLTDQDIAWAAADPWPAGRIELHLTDDATSRCGAILDGARDGRVFRVSCGGQSLFVGVFYSVNGAAALDTPVLHEARENGVLILRLGAYQSAWFGWGIDQPASSPLRERIDRAELRAALCRRGVLHVLDPNARPASP